MFPAVERLSPDHAEDVITAFCDAFHDYPVMRHVVGEAGDDYDRRLRELIAFFVMNRVWRGEPVLGVVEEGMVVAAATLTPPGERDVPAETAPRRERLWKLLGGEAEIRYEACGAAWGRFALSQPHYHVNMIGVVRARAGTGLARRLLDAVHETSAAEPASAGVSLTTEDPANVPFYEHFGYEVIGYSRVAPELESWSFFRPD